MDASPRQRSLPANLARRVTYLAYRVAIAAGQKANAALAPLGIDTRHYAILTALGTDTMPSQQTIAATLGIDRATVVALVDDLEQRSLVRRAPSREDRRANTIELTAAGREILARADHLMDGCEASFIATLPAREREQIAAILYALFIKNA
ncbi:MAG: MarR family transcriptional regulator [Chloroflexota bacterium]|nr:MarR family transcriptional regulator [Chloroflexota bacterium]